MDGNRVGREGGCDESGGSVATGFQLVYIIYIINRIIVRCPFEVGDRVSRAGDGYAVEWSGGGVLG